MTSEPTLSVYSNDAAIVGYTVVRHIGLILDELSSQGLEVWRDERRHWLWRWQGTDLHAERGFWALGEALIDAVVARYPKVFALEMGEVEP
jgi:hypothetical protein